jgi:hypothetical protein
MRRSPALVRRSVFVLLAALCVLAAGETGAQRLAPSEVELEDVIEIELLGRDLYAFNLIGAGSPEVRLEIGEDVVWQDSRGRVGIVLTDRRALAVSPANGGWREIRYQVHETRPDHAQIGTRVGLVVTSHRVLGFDATSGFWLVKSLGPNERIEVARVGAGTAVVLTNRKAYGLSPSAGGFFSVDMAIHERVERVSVKANMATISTTKRLLVFRAPVGIWTTENRKIH